MTARDAVDDGRTYGDPAPASPHPGCTVCASGVTSPHGATATAGQASPVDVNELPVTPAAAALYRLCSGWERQALRIPWMLGEKDPRAVTLQDCSIALRDAVNGLRRDGDL